MDQDLPRPGWLAPPGVRPLLGGQEVRAGGRARRPPRHGPVRPVRRVRQSAGLLRVTGRWAPRRLLGDLPGVRGGRGPGGRRAGRAGAAGRDLEEGATTTVRRPTAVVPWGRGARSPSSSPPRRGATSRATTDRPRSGNQRPRGNAELPGGYELLVTWAGSGYPSTDRLTAQPTFRTIYFRCLRSILAFKKHENHERSRR